MLKEKLKIVKIKSEYINYLRKYDSKVEYNQKELKKDNRPFIGILFNINNKSYYAPISSANNNKKVKFGIMFEKYNKIGISPIDIIFICDKNNNLLSVINLNNMIPVKEENIIEYDILKDKNASLLIKEYIYCSKIRVEIIRIALKIYSI